MRGGGANLSPRVRIVIRWIGQRIAHWLRWDCSKMPRRCLRRRRICPWAIDPPAAVAPRMSALGRLAASIEENSMKGALSGIVAEHIRAVNAFDTDAVVATFAEDAYVNDNRREIVGIDAVRQWVEKEMVGDKRSSTALSASGV